MIKQLQIKRDRIELITNICFIGVSSAELKLLKIMLSFSTGNSLTITADVAKQIMLTADMGQSSFNTNIHRLYKKGIMSSMGRTKVFHPVYNNILDCDKLLISFVNPTPQTEQI